MALLTAVAQRELGDLALAPIPASAVQRCTTLQAIAGARIRFPPLLHFAMTGTVRKQQHKQTEIDWCSGRQSAWASIYDGFGGSNESRCNAFPAIDPIN